MLALVLLNYVSAQWIIQPVPYFVVWNQLFPLPNLITARFSIVLAPNVEVIPIDSEPYLTPPLSSFLQGMKLI